MLYILLTFLIRIECSALFASYIDINIHNVLKQFILIIIGTYVFTWSLTLSAFNSSLVARKSFVACWLACILAMDFSFNSFCFCCSRSNAISRSFFLRVYSCICDRMIGIEFQSIKFEIKSCYIFITAKDFV